MDNLRVFSTFPKSKVSYSKKSKKSRKQILKDLPRDKNGMIERSLVSKPSLSRNEILGKLKASKKGLETKSLKPEGKRFGDGFMVDESSEVSNGDIKKNNPNNPMTTEKLKSMLNSGVVNFSGKEQEILSKILGK